MQAISSQPIALLGCLDEKAEEIALVWLLMKVAAKLILSPKQTDDLVHDLVVRYARPPCGVPSLPMVFPTPISGKIWLGIPPLRY